MFLKLILLAIGLSLLLLAVRRLSRYRLKERYTLVFLFIGMPFVALALWPDAIGYLSDKLGIQYHTLIILFVTAFFALSTMELLTIVSIQDRKIANLAQIVGILMSEQKQQAAGRPASPVEPPVSPRPSVSIRLEDHRTTR